MLFNTVYNLALNVLVELSFDIFRHHSYKVNVLINAPLTPTPDLHFILEGIQQFT